VKRERTKLTERFPKSILGVSAGWLTLFGSVAGSLFADGNIGAGVFGTFIAATVAPAAFSSGRALLHDLRRRRANAAHDRHLAELGAIRSRAAALPEDVRAEWLQLNDAARVANDLARRGWVDEAAVDEISRGIEHLADVLEADAATDRVGGRPAVQPRRDLAELLDLTVALCDEAVDHRHSEARRQPVRVQDARDRLRARTQARQELGGL
jgi:hypothetical protein